MTLGAKQAAYTGSGDATQFTFLKPAGPAWLRPSVMGERGRTTSYRPREGVLETLGVSEDEVRDAVFSSFVNSNRTCHASLRANNVERTGLPAGGSSLCRELAGWS